MGEGCHVSRVQNGRSPIAVSLLLYSSVLLLTMDEKKVFEALHFHLDQDVLERAYSIYPADHRALLQHATGFGWIILTWKTCTFHLPQISDTLLCGN